MNFDIKINYIRPKDVNVRKRIAVAYSSKERVELTTKTIPILLRDQRIDLFWFDGSTSVTAKNLPSSVNYLGSSLLEVHENVIGGPDKAIVYALSYLQNKNYDWIILIENDILLEEDWLSVMMQSTANAELNGYTVGAATCRVYKERILRVHKDHCLMWNSGAGMIAFKSWAVDIILQNYRTTSACEIRNIFRNKTGVDIKNYWNFLSDDQPLSCDWLFDALLYENNAIVCAPLRSYCIDLDEKYLAELDIASVKNPTDLPTDRINNDAIEVLNSNNIGSSKFLCIQNSKRTFLPLHYINAGNDCKKNTVSFLSSSWKYKWVQLFGPFGMNGIGKVRIKLWGSSLSAVVISHETSEVILHDVSTNCITRKYILENGKVNFIELVSDANTYPIEYNISFTNGNISFIGLDIPPHLTGFYCLKNINIFSSS